MVTGIQRSWSPGNSRETVTPESCHVRGETAQRRNRFGRGRVPGHAMVRAHRITDDEARPMTRLGASVAEMSALGASVAEMSALPNPGGP